MEVLIPARGLLLVDVPKETTSRSGLIRPQFERKAETMRGTVLKIGEAKEKEASIEVAVGDSILFCPTAAIEVMHENETFFFVGQEDVVALIQGTNTAPELNGRVKELFGVA